MKENVDYYEELREYSENEVDEIISYPKKCDDIIDVDSMLIGF